MKRFGKLALAIASLLIIPSAIAESRQRNPLQTVTRLESPNIIAPSHRIHAHSHFQATFSLADSPHKVRLSLEPNHDVVAEGATITYLGADGKIQKTEPIERLDHRVYKGNAFVQYAGQTEWVNAGWARIHVHRDGPEPLFEGAFQLYGDHHHIQTNTNYQKTRLRDDPEIEPASDEYLILWRDSDLKGDGHSAHSPDELKRALAKKETCTSDQLDYNADENHPIYRSLDGLDGFDGLEARSSWSSMASNMLFGRQMDGTTGGNGAGANLVSTIGSTSGCPSARKVALIGIATDCTYTAEFDGNETAIRSNIINQVNTASQLYESTFDISLGIRNLTISPQACPSTASSDAPWNVGCSDSVSITDRLILFSEWRGQHEDSNAYWTLMSTCGTGSAVGLAWLGQLCMVGSSTSSDGGNETVAAANVVVRTDGSTEWQVFAHETGHTFGAVHDCTSSSCADGTSTKQQCCPLSSSSCDANGRYLMNPSTGTGITQFSACSIGNVCSALGRQSVQSNCLTDNRDVTTITGSQCGNGIVESGEDCQIQCLNNNVCYELNQNFLDGTTCGGGGKCRNGVCQGASAGDEILAWINDNKQIFIPVVSTERSQESCAIKGTKASGRMGVYLATAACYEQGTETEPVYGRRPAPDV
ncbi:putative zinc metalloprotease mde10 [Diaporthe ampelina]|uniref:Putative zinc metalloprotease mde10 n=1 Tax=Diaporthe ampelina TaxID=1214573 RepID=A0A0G2FKJ4_9PEZI|nr:putative zinc metalloprotease mde10 [Diaporthe ampelina]